MSLIGFIWASPLAVYLLLSSADNFCKQFSVVTVPFLTASLLGLLFSDMVRVVDCHTGVPGLNPGLPKDFSLWNYFNGVRSV